MAVQTQTPRLIAGRSRISRSPAWALCALASRYKSSRTGPDDLAGLRPRGLHPRARRLRRAGPGSKAIAAPLGEFYDVTQFAAISGSCVRRDSTARTG